MFVLLIVQLQNLSRHSAPLLLAADSAQNMACLFWGANFLGAKSQNGLQVTDSSTFFLTFSLV